jgi:predicted peptidase
MGGYATWALACKHPTMFAAAAPICGGGDPAEAAKIKDLPIWNFHGDKDTAVPIAKSNEMIEALKTAGGTPKYTVYPGVGHNSWDKAYRDEKLWDWFLQFERK